VNTVYFDSGHSDAERRRLLYSGQVFVFSPRQSVLALVDWAREMLVGAFAPHDPREAQYAMDVQGFVDVFGPLKPAFIHHPRTALLLRDVVAELGCDLEETYVDVPRLRGVTSDGYLTAGVGYAHPMHRDTWWAAPMCQLNWWLPLFPIESESSMAFHPDFWSRGVPNGSEEFDYYEWNQVGRAEAAKHVTSDTRKQPHPQEPIASDPQVRLIPPPGGLVLFSGAQMHSTVPNTTGLTRFSIDFRTVNLADAVAHAGAPNVDSLPRGTSLRDFRRGSDGAPMPEEVALSYDPREVDEAVAVFRPPPLAAP
jgi:hypothetical protein